MGNQKRKMVNPTNCDTHSLELSIDKKNLGGNHVL